MNNETNIRDEDLILYIATKLKNSESFGSIMLNKVLYYADNIHYLRHGRPISSFRYVNRAYGPTPNPDSFLPLRGRLIREGKAKEAFSESINNNRKKLVALKPYSKNLFSPTEIEILDEVISSFHDRTAYEVSDISHNELGWKLTKEGEEIPFHAFALQFPALDNDDFDWAEDELKKLNLDCA